MTVVNTSCFGNLGQQFWSKQRASKNQTFIFQFDLKLIPRLALGVGPNHLGFN